MEPDLTYSDDGLFIAFYADTAAGEEACRELAKHSEGTCKFLASQKAGIIAQLRAAGYRVAKAKPHKPLAPAELDRLLEALEGDLSR